MEKYGYDEIELAGYTQGSAGPITLAQLKRLAKDHGLNPIGSHVGYYDDNNPGAYTFAQNLEKVLDDAQALGLKHIGTASGPSATARRSTAGSGRPTTSTSTGPPPVSAG